MIGKVRKVKYRIRRTKIKREKWKKIKIRLKRKKWKRKRRNTMSEKNRRDEVKKFFDALKSILKNIERVIVIIVFLAYFVFACIMFCKCYGQINELISNTTDAIYLYCVFALIVITLIICITVIIGLMLKFFYRIYKEKDKSHSSEILYKAYKEIIDNKK